MTRARDVANLIGSGNYSSTTFTATAGQTAFTISHTQGFIQVFMNGLLLDETVDYTSNGSAVTLTSGAAAGDEIEVVKYNTFSVGDALNQSAADTRYVNTTGDTMTGALTVDTSTTTNLTVDSGNYGGIQLKAAGTDTGYITSYTNGSGTESMYIGGADNVLIHTGTNHALSNGTTRLGIDVSGRVTMPNQPAFSQAGYSTFTVTATGTQVMSGSNVWASNVSHSYSSTNSGWNASTGTFTAPVAGRYIFHLTYFLTAHNSGYWYSYLQHNGSTKTYGYVPQTSTHLCVTQSAIFSMAANDTARAAWTNNYATGQIYGTSFSGHLIG